MDLENLMDQATVRVESISSDIVEAGDDSAGNGQSDVFLSPPQSDDNSIEDSGSDVDIEPEAAEPDDGPTALDEAYSQALAERDATIIAQQRQIAAAELAQRAPRLLAFEDLDAATQSAVLDESARAGIEPSAVLYSLYREQLASYRAQVDGLNTSLEVQRQQAFESVRNFVTRNEHVAKLPAAERDAFIAGIGQLEAVQAINDLAFTAPAKWAKAVSAIAGREIASLGARAVVASNEQRTQSAMKQAAGSSGKPAGAAKVQSTTQDPFADMDLGGHRSWDQRLKLSRVK